MMNDDKIKQIMKTDVPPADTEAKKQAIHLAMSEFAEQQKSHQGNSSRWRPISDVYHASRKLIMNTMNNKLLYSGFASLFVAVMGVLLFQQVYIAPDQQIEEAYVLDKDISFTKQETEIEPIQSIEAKVAQVRRPEKPIISKPQLTNRTIAKITPSVSSGALSSNVQNFSAELEEVVVQGAISDDAVSYTAPVAKSKLAQPLSIAEVEILPYSPDQEKGRDRFESVKENKIKRVSEEPVSTFSIDVDTASYSFVRRQLNQGVLPQKDAVRIEEMVNYFDYQYPLPTSKQEPFQSTVMVQASPWSNKQLVHIGIKGYDISAEKQPRSNLVLLLDVSGSMNSPDKLPLVKQSMSLLMSSLQPNDTIAIVVYAGAAGKVLAPTKVKEKQKILDALNRLQAGGSTAGAQGIQLAYQLAEANFDKEAVNRIILATDGDFNVGIQNREELKGFVERKRKQGIFLSVLGFGQGNYHDHMMQTLAQNGNGVAAYIDSLSEAQKVLINEATSSLFPIAKDVKIQVEFNPQTVEEYRLIGYETRHLNRQDFNNDNVDAGDIGAGHTVTAIYEITPKGGVSTIDDLRYNQQKSQTDKTKQFTNEYGFLKIRYKLPEESQSKLITQAINTTMTKPSAALQTEMHFASAVAGFAQLLKGGQYTQQYSYDDIIELAQRNKGEDKFGYRTEFIQLVRKAKIANAM